MGGGGGVTSPDKSVFLRTRQGCDYGYGEWGVRDPNPSNLDKGILKANANFETTDKMTVL